jgi:hypothetical protein
MYLTGLGGEVSSVEVVGRLAVDLSSIARGKKIRKMGTNELYCSCDKCPS